MHTSKKLNNHPLVIALAEFRFSPVLGINKFIPDVQEKLRNYFPHSKELETKEIQLEKNGIQVKESKEWAFISAQKDSAIMLNNNRLVYLTSSYNRFDDFSEKCKHGLDVLNEIVKPELLERIGLRYSDTIKAADEQSTNKCVIDSVYSNENFKTLGNPIRKTQENILKTKSGYMIIRTMAGFNNFPVWPDLNNLPLELKFEPTVSYRILLDFDHYWQHESNDKPLSFDVEFSLDTLNNLHSDSREAFWEITTKEGRLVWK